jgi:anti-sigma B factor antagonist
MSTNDAILTSAGPADPDPLLTCQLIRHGDVTVIAISGELDMGTAHLLTDLASVAAQGRSRRVVLDLAGVTFLSAAGLRALLMARERFCEAGAFVAVRDPRPLVQRILTITGVDTLLPTTTGANLP